LSWARNLSRGAKLQGQGSEGSTRRCGLNEVTVTHISCG
jgi:hypothetical protein